MRISLYILPLAIWSTIACAQQGKSLEQLDKEAQYKKVIAASDNALLALNSLTAERELQCEKAVGNQKFCKCLSENVPFDFNFNQYIAIMTRTKKENGYSGLSRDQKKLYDAVPGVRDMCVQEK